MSEYDRGRKQFILGLVVVALVAPLVAGLAAFAAAVGALVAADGYKRMNSAERDRGATPAPPAALPRLATQRPVMRTGNRGPGRRSTARRHSRTFH
ncbi:hypothetical protein [Nocardia huaxiensis]|uniref:Uncharacterized protein n=1 Tax=Nocardia huaxiensis TaxID=2755382 RepID=A0A7D6V9J2_9NOCA|nr:hypothetical protein [Nocardia huaxiensis]QLY29611.1 hypothetical protein H0264_30910 [Nocardia huaxiensis]UFS96817.1 hypothetical protein LPY97_02470 [Nocardia huaxiensis]